MSTCDWPDLRTQGLVVRSATRLFGPLQSDMGSCRIFRAWKFPPGYSNGSYRVMTYTRSSLNLMAELSVATCCGRTEKSLESVR